MYVVLVRHRIAHESEMDKRKRNYCSAISNNGDSGDFRIHTNMNRAARARKLSLICFS